MDLEFGIVLGQERIAEVVLVAGKHIEGEELELDAQDSLVDCEQNRPRDYWK